MKRQIYLLMVTDRQFFALGYPHEGGSVNRTFAFTERFLAEDFGRSMIKGAFGVEGIDGDRFLFGMLETLPKRMDIVNIDAYPLPLTEKGVLYLASGADSAMEGFTAEEWTQHIVKGTWKQRRFDLLVRALGEDEETPLEWNTADAPEVGPTEGYGSGKTKRRK